MKIVGTAIIVNDKNEILIGQRPQGKDLAGLWEFPGGKQENGETIEECIVRELKEELNVDTVVKEFLLDVVKDYKHGEFKLSVYRVEIKDIENLKALVHQDLKWVRVDELNNFEFPVADVDIIDFILKYF
jgi:8-oxo-dGTP diphosphatase